MPIKIPNDLPAVQTLQEENIFVMTETRAITQDIRPLQILLLNLMPTKVDTETQLARVLGNTPLQIELELIAPAGHVSKNTSQAHMLAFYKSFAEVKDRTFDGLVITGAPVELMDFEEVDYWPELCEIMGVTYCGQNVKYLEAAFKNLRNKSAYIELGDGKRMLFAWLDTLIFDRTTGLVEVKLSASLEPFLIALRNRYYKYEIANLLALKGKAVFLFDSLQMHLYEGKVTYTVEELKDIGAGYRAPYIKASAQRIVDGYDLEPLRNMSLDEARKELLTFLGVGPKVADCILLFSLGHTDAFPVDVWIGRAMKELYFDSEPPTKAALNKVIENIAKKFRRALPKWLDFINRSFLPEDLKRAYKHLILQRVIMLR